MFDKLKRPKKEITNKLQDAFLQNSELFNKVLIRAEILNNVSFGSRYIFQFAKWLVIAIFSGFVCGFLGSVFYKSIEVVTNYRYIHHEITYFLPVAGVIIVFLYRFLGMKKDRGTNLVLASIHSHKQIPGVMAPLIYIGTVLTHLCGGSSGREGAALQMGGCVGVFIGKKLKMDEKDINVLTMCGMSAVFTAMFGTPITATVFSMEVITVGMFHYSAFVPCIIASTISKGVTQYFGIEGETFTILRTPDIDIYICLKIVALAIACGVVAIIFCQGIHGVSKLYKNIFSNPYVRIIVGGTLVTLIINLADLDYYSGAGFNIVRDSFNGITGIHTVIIKIVLTALTLGAGYKGGEIVPALCIGASFGSVVAPVLGFEPAFGAGIGLVSLFCGVVNCPIAAILLAMEMFGQHRLLPFAIASGVSYVFSGCFGLYNSQKILYSKLHAEYINTHTR